MLYMWACTVVVVCIQALSPPATPALLTTEYGMYSGEIANTSPPHAPPPLPTPLPTLPASPRFEDLGQQNPHSRQPPALPRDHLPPGPAVPTPSKVVAGAGGR